MMKHTLLQYEVCALYCMHKNKIRTYSALNEGNALKHMLAVWSDVRNGIKGHVLSSFVYVTLYMYVHISARYNIDESFSQCSNEYQRIYNIFVPCIEYPAPEASSANHTWCLSLSVQSNFQIKG